MPLIAVSYYRPPYPDFDHWQGDFEKMSEIGIGAIQVEMPWGWMEPEPDNFHFDDYDKLFSAAESAGLKVIAVLKPEHQPNWVMRNYPEARFSSENCEDFSEVKSPAGRFPGCNPDHPDVWERMSRFIQRTVRHFAPKNNLHAWVAFQLDQSYPISFDQTVRSGFEKWLQDQFKSLNDLNKSWKRRYSKFDDIASFVTLGSGTPEELSFLQYQSVRMVRHAKARTYMVRSTDPTHQIVIYGNKPFLRQMEEGSGIQRAMPLGSDWELAESADIYASACYPMWTDQSDSQRDVRLKFERSVAGLRPFWMGEYSRPKNNPNASNANSLDIGSYLRWLWQGLSKGTECVTFNNWRDSPVGPQNGSTGLAGNDGSADERLEALKQSLEVIDSNKTLLANAESTEPKIGVLFSITSYEFACSQNQGNTYWSGFYDYCMVLSQLGYSYRVISEKQLADMNDIDILFLPRLSIIASDLEFNLNQFLAKNSIIFAEGQCGAYTENGEYIQPKDRWISRRSHIMEKNQQYLAKGLEAIKFDNGSDFLLNLNHQIYPLTIGDEGTILHRMRFDEHHETLFAKAKVESGEIYYVGAQLGGDEQIHLSRGLHEFLTYIVDQLEGHDSAKIVYPQRKANGHISVHSAKSEEKKLFFIFCDGNYKEVGLRLPAATYSGEARELLSGATVKVHARSSGASGQDCKVPLSKWGIAVLAPK